MLVYSGMLVLLLLLSPPVVLVCSMYLFLTITTVIYSFLGWLNTILLCKMDTESKMGPHTHSAELVFSASTA